MCIDTLARCFLSSLDQCQLLVSSKYEKFFTWGCCEPVLNYGFEFIIDLFFLNTIFFYTLCGHAYLSVMDGNYIFEDLIIKWIDTKHSVQTIQSVKSEYFVFM